MCYFMQPLEHDDVLSDPPGHDSDVQMTNMTMVPRIKRPKDNLQNKFGSRIRQNPSVRLVNVYSLF